ncbi:MAG: hypothetical protein JWM88_258 [Verrucomicrobia bacterium]|nr:hypothetical protein [Verrucomicrobiota bacterium]
MFLALQKEWQWLLNSRPGVRFQNRYRRTRADARRDARSPRVFRVVLAVLAFLVGICVIPLPFPEIPFFLISGALLATESLSLARGLDQFEKRLHTRFRLIRRKIGLPRRAERPLAVGMFVASLTVTSCVAYLALRP